MSEINYNIETGEVNNLPTESIDSNFTFNFTVPAQGSGSENLIITAILTEEAKNNLGLTFTTDYIDKLLTFNWLASEILQPLHVALTQNQYNNLNPIDNEVVYFITDAGETNELNPTIITDINNWSYINKAINLIQKLKKILE